jgi:hypothetical protein
MEIRAYIFVYIFLPIVLGEIISLLVSFFIIDNQNNHFGNEMG